MSEEGAREVFRRAMETGGPERFMGASIWFGAWDEMYITRTTRLMHVRVLYKPTVKGFPPMSILTSA